MLKTRDFPCYNGKEAPVRVSWETSSHCFLSFLHLLIEVTASGRKIKNITELFCPTKAGKLR